MKDNRVIISNTLIWAANRIGDALDMPALDIEALSLALRRNMNLTPQSDAYEENLKTIRLLLQGEGSAPLPPQKQEEEEEQLNDACERLNGKQR